MEIIKKLRKQKNMTQGELAKELNVVVSTISKWESGATEPGVRELKILAEYFETTVDDIIQSKAHTSTTVKQAAPVSSQDSFNIGKASFNKVWFAIGLLPLILSGLTLLIWAQYYSGSQVKSSTIAIMSICSAWFFLSLFISNKQATK